MKYTRQQILDMIEEEGVEFIRLQFTDLFGTPKNVAITANQIEKALNGDCFFDSSAITAFRDMINTDLYLNPDIDSFVIFPWRPQQGKVARLLCDICNADGTPFDGDSRLILKRTVERAKQAGYSFLIKPELEFFLFPTDENGSATVNSREKASYFDIGPLDHGENARRDIVLSLQDMGYQVESSFHEVAHAQHEIVLAYADPLAAADNLVTAKLTVKAIASKHGLHATFMPKPVYGQNGSGMHLEFTLYDDNINRVFSDQKDPNGLSEMGYQFIAGILSHACEFASVTNPTVNSYKRLVPGTDASVYIGWSDCAKNQIVRLVRKKSGSVSIEVTHPDPTANPYYTIALLIAAGLDGIAHRLPAPEKILVNYEQETKATRLRDGVDKMPGNLHEAIQRTEEGSFVAGVLGENLLTHYIAAKRTEWNRFREQVTNWEIDNYLNQY